MGAWSRTIANELLYERLHEWLAMSGDANEPRRR
jgi:hypothetical protein